MTTEPTTNTEPDTEPQVELGKVELDLLSFDRNERRALQVRYDNDFNTLCTYVLEAVGKRQGLSELKLVDAKGGRVFADDVFISMLTIARQRTDPDAKETDLADLGMAGLRDLIAPKDSPKRGKSSTPKKT